MDVDALRRKATKAQDNADRAFRRWFQGETWHPAAAQRLQGVADEAWRELTSHPDYDQERHGDQKMWGETYAPGSALEG